jgi:tRNA(Leu) C34 or U34 (ribose-2'-O)-methylase TrmL
MSSLTPRSVDESASSAVSVPAMRMRGFAAIGLVRPKCHENVGSVLRAAFCYDAAMVAIQGDRSFIRSRLDTGKAWRHIPVLRGDDLHALIPFDAVPVAVDLVDGAVSLPAFQHPQRAFYVFGPEDGTLGKAVLAWCAHRVSVPTRMCMNLAATVNVVLYDRMAKADRVARGIRYADLSQRAA